MTEQEKKILDTFKEVLPKMSDRDKEKLLWIGEGLHIKTDDNYKKTR